MDNQSNKAAPLESEVKNRVRYGTFNKNQNLLNDFVSFVTFFEQASDLPNHFSVYTSS